MYCVTSSQNENEYLCTVRCGAALRDEEVLHTNGFDDESARRNGSNGVVTEANSQRGCNSNTNEDDWVEVKAPDGPALDCKNNSSITTSGGDSLRMIKQVCYIDLTYISLTKSSFYPFHMLFGFSLCNGVLSLRFPDLSFPTILISDRSEM